MNEEFQKNSVGRECQNNGQGLLSPKDAVELLEAGVPLEEALIWLDVDQCHFMPRVDDKGEKPLIKTGFPSYTAPSGGRLVFSLEEMESVQKAGEKVILVVSLEMLASLYERSKELDGAIILCPETKKLRNSYHYSHLLQLSIFFKSSLLDGSVNPQITLLKGQNKIEMPNGRKLNERDFVTIDPISGRLWDKELPFLVPDEDTQRLSELLCDLTGTTEKTCIAGHVFYWCDYVNILRYKEDTKEDISVGLQRTEMECSMHLRDQDKDFFTSLSKGAIPASLRTWDLGAFNGLMQTNYRLPDLHNLRNLLPEEFKKALDQGDEHKLGTPLFNMWKTLYQHQLKTAFLNNTEEVKSCEHEIRIIIPSVRTPEEVARFKAMVEEVTPEEFKDKVKFGVMMETEEALENTRDIAKICDCLCYGTNDLTADVTGLGRSVLDHSEWMNERGYKGCSPFECFVPEVLEKLGKSILEAREVKPDIVINICGHQVAGHDIDSVLAVLGMGVDMITVPPTEEHFNRARLLVAQYEARMKPGLSLYDIDNIDSEPDLFLKYG